MNQYSDAKKALEHCKWEADNFPSRAANAAVKRAQAIIDQLEKEESTMRKVSQQVNNKGTKKAIIYRDAGSDEYVVKFYDALPNGMWHYLVDGDYHTDDKDDAIATAIYVVSKV